MALPPYLCRQPVLTIGATSSAGNATAKWYEARAFETPEKNLANRLLYKKYTISRKKGYGVMP